MNVSLSSYDYMKENPPDTEVVKSLPEALQKLASPSAWEEVEPVEGIQIGSEKLIVSDSQREDCRKVARHPRLKERRIGQIADMLFRAKVRIK